MFAYLKECVQIVLHNFLFCRVLQSYGISIENVFSVELSACPSLEEMKKLPNKVLLWCGMTGSETPFMHILSRILLFLIIRILGTRSSNMLRHLQKGFLLAPCSLPVPGYMARSINYQLCLRLLLHALLLFR